MIFAVTGSIWFTLAGVMVLALACAAQGAMPQPLLAGFAPGVPPRLLPEAALDDTADQRALLDTPAPAPESIPEKAGR